MPTRNSSAVIRPTPLSAKRNAFLARATVAPCSARNAASWETAFSMNCVSDSPLRSTASRLAFVSGVTRMGGKVAERLMRPVYSKCYTHASQEKACFRLSRNLDDRFGAAPRGCPQSETTRRVGKCLLKPWASPVTASPKPLACSNGASMKFAQEIAPRRRTPPRETLVSKLCDLSHAFASPTSD